MRQPAIAVLSTLIILLAACAGEPETSRESETAVDPGARVDQLVAEAWAHALEQNPYLLNRQGTLVSEFPDLTPTQAAEQVAWSRRMLERIDALPRQEMSHEDELTLECLRWDNQIVVEGEPWYWHQFAITPYSAGYIAPSAQTLLASYTFDEADQMEKYAGLVAEYGDHFDQLLAHTRGQMERGIYLSKHALPGVQGLFHALRQGAMRSAVMAGEERLAKIPEAQRQEFVARIEGIVAQRIEPALDQLIALLGSDDYRAPDTVGAGSLPDGQAYYRYLIKMNTTMDKTSEELHQFGQQRVVELEANMAAIRDELGFAGTRQEFHDLLRTDPRFLAETPEDVEARYRKYLDAIEPLVDDYFPTRPRAPYGVKRLDPAQEATMTFGFYQAPTPAQPVGRYRYNGSKLDERSLVWAGPLIFHELVPGHHFHIALQNENESIPFYRRENIAYGAFTEGWGNYAAKLGAEMGLLDDPYDRYGWNLFEIFFATRLVVDTGMNAMGWSLEDGRQYMRDHTFQSETEIATESLRYSTDMPGQALNYHAGFQKLLDLRERAKELAGDSFDIKDFHDAVLGNGGLPMEVLEAHIEWYFDPTRRSGGS